MIGIIGIAAAMHIIFPIIEDLLRGPRCLPDGHETQYRMAN